MKQLDNKIALVTGASSGIGRCVAKRFASEGAIVILAGRNQSDLEVTHEEIVKLKYPSPITVVIDLQNLTEVTQLANLILNRYKRLDILVGNAATIHTLQPIYDYDPLIWHKIINTNLTANWYLIKHFHNLLLKSTAGRAIFTTCTIHEKDFWGPYAISKVALDQMVKMYSSNLSQTKVKANLVDPGRVGTDLYKLVSPGADLTKLLPPSDVTDVFLKLATEEFVSNGQVFYAQ